LNPQGGGLWVFFFFPFPRWEFFILGVGGGAGAVIPLAFLEKKKGWFGGVLGFNSGGLFFHYMAVGKVLGLQGSLVLGGWAWLRVFRVGPFQGWVNGLRLGFPSWVFSSVFSFTPSKGGVGPGPDGFPQKKTLFFPGR